MLYFKDGATDIYEIDETLDAKSIRLVGSAKTKGSVCSYAKVRSVKDMFFVTQEFGTSRSIALLYENEQLWEAPLMLNDPGPKITPGQRGRFLIICNGLYSWDRTHFKYLTHHATAAFPAFGPDWSRRDESQYFISFDHGLGAGVLQVSEMQNGQLKTFKQIDIHKFARSKDGKELPIDSEDLWPMAMNISRRQVAGKREPVLLIGWSTHAAGGPKKISSYSTYITEYILSEALDESLAKIRPLNGAFENKSISGEWNCQVTGVTRNEQKDGDEIFYIGEMRSKYLITCLKATAAGGYDVSSHLEHKDAPSSRPCSQLECLPD